MDKTMRTLVVDKNGKLSLEECPIPSYGECDALVKTISCGVCSGTDGKLIHRTFKGFTPDMYPIMLGHEAVGEVIEVGSKVTSYKVGDRVLLPFAGPLGGFESGWGAYSEYGVVNDAAAYAANGKQAPECAYGQTIVPNDIDPVKAAMIVTFREVLSSIKRFGIGANAEVVVYGCGPVGLTFIKFMSILGVGKIIALDIIPEKLKDAQKNGADYVFNAQDPDIVGKVREICPDGVGYVLDAVGVLDIMNRAMPMLKDQGKICCYGIASETKFELDWLKAPYNWQLHFQQFPSKIEEGMADKQVITWIRQGIINIDDYISDIIPFDDILSAFDKVEKKQIAKKCIIKYSH
ncbi:MAG: zinc-dependent alcohol dehydrogenase [Burkholderiales bacterium]